MILPESATHEFEVSERRVSCLMLREAGTSRPKKLQTREVGPFLSVFVFLPLLLIGAILSRPLGPIFNWWQKRKKRLLKDAVAKRGGLMPWNDFVPTAEEKRGTLIIEGNIFKGPNLWWTAEDVRAMSPHPYPGDSDDFRSREFQPFRAWCYRRYSDPVTGCALLVVGGGRERLGFARSHPDLQGKGIFKEMPTVLIGAWHTRSEIEPELGRANCRLALIGLFCRDNVPRRW